MTDNNLVDLTKIPVSALRTSTKNAIASLLNPLKIFVTDNGLPRDWRGLAHLVGIPAQTMPALIGSRDPTSTIIDLLNQDDVGIVNLNKLLSHFEELDRYDVADDIITHFQADAINYINNVPAKTSTDICTVPPASVSDDHIITRHDGAAHFQTYDAFVLYDDDDAQFAYQLVTIMETEYGMTLCLKDRDMVAGHNSYTAIQRLISERCSKVIVILSNSFFMSSANTFIAGFAQAVGIDQQQRKIIPCTYKMCDIPPQWSSYSKLKFDRHDPFFNVWDKLRESIIPLPLPSSGRVGIREIHSPAPTLVIEGYREQRMQQLALPNIQIQHSTSSSQINQSPNFYNPSPVLNRLVNFPPISQSVSESNLILNDHIVFDNNVQSVRSTNHNNSFVMRDSMADGILPSFESSIVNNNGTKKKKWSNRLARFLKKKTPPVIAD